MGSFVSGRKNEVTITASYDAGRASEASQSIPLPATLNMKAQEAFPSQYRKFRCFCALIKMYVYILIHVKETNRVTQVMNYRPERLEY